MNVTEAVQRRRSIRAFQERAVDPDLLREVLAQAARAPSGGNLQPWRIYVLANQPLAQLKAAMEQRLAQRPTPDLPLEYEVYPSPLSEPYRGERYAVGEALYERLGIPREDKAARLRWFMRNYQFFGAPAALLCYVDRGMGPPQWSDLGMYLQTVMLLLQERGIDSCAQECWSVYHREVAAVVSPPPELMLFCGLALGYADAGAAVNGLSTRRLPLDQFAQFLVD